jgi:hypothetical protein
LLAPLTACLSALGPRQERVLVRRAGLRGFRGLSRAELAASLGIRVGRVARIERRALRTLRRLVRENRCAAAKVPATAAALTPAAPTFSSATPSAGPPVTRDQQAVKHAVAFGGGAPLSSLFKGAATLPPQAVGREVARAGRSYAEDHPFQVALAILVVLLCALPLLRELKRARVR